VNLDPPKDLIAAEKAHLQDFHQGGPVIPKYTPGRSPDPGPGIFGKRKLQVALDDPSLGNGKHKQQPAHKAAQCPCGQVADEAFQHAGTSAFRSLTRKF
jgi:hypothetical protein